MDIFITYLHYIGIMALMAALLTEHTLFNKHLDENRIKSLAVVDAIYGISAVVVLVSGLLRWLVYEKGFDFYMQNPVFHTKLTLFVILAILSIYPTVMFLRFRKQLKRGSFEQPEKKVVKRIQLFLRIELLIMLIIPLLAVLMARGIGY